MQYKKNFLSDVILRVDFDSSEEALKTELCQEITSAITDYFPDPGGGPTKRRYIEVKNEASVDGNVISKDYQFNEWHFWGLGREKELCITHSCLFIVYKKYDSFSVLHEEFFHVLDAVLGKYPQIRISRVGLRYIDKIKPDVMREAKQNWYKYWREYINEALIQGLNFSCVDPRMTRHLNSIEMKYDGYQLRFTYGISNEDYPAPNKRNVFILDTDVYSGSLSDFGDVRSYVTEFHEQAKIWFESAITDSLREIMNEQQKRRGRSNRGNDNLRNKRTSRTRKQ